LSSDAADRFGYRTWLTIPTRWNDNDVYGHVNNVEYLAFFDTAVNSHLITTGALDVQHGPVIGLCVESHCTYHAPLTFPDVVDAGLRVAQLGRSSVRYEIGLFKADDAEPAAHGYFVHVFVDRETRRPVAIPPGLRSALEAISIDD
jgi:acyl-CoA thioester hydrolase